MAIQTFDKSGHLIDDRDLEQAEPPELVDDEPSDAVGGTEAPAEAESDVA